MFADEIDYIEQHDIGISCMSSMHGYNLLEYSILGGSLELVKRLVDLNADINELRYDMIPLELAIINRQEDIIKYLINEGADINRLNRDGLSPLCVLFSYNRDYEYSHIFDFFIDNGADIDGKNMMGINPLLHALKTNCPIGHVKFLIEKGAKLMVMVKLQQDIL